MTVLKRRKEEGGEVKNGSRGIPETGILRRFWLFHSFQNFANLSLCFPHVPTVIWPFFVGRMQHYVSYQNLINKKAWNLPRNTRP